MSDKQENTTNQEIKESQEEQQLHSQQSLEKNEDIIGDKQIKENKILSENEDDEEEELQENVNEVELEEEDEEQKQLRIQEAQEKALEQKEKMEEYQQQQNQKGVCYLSKIPPYMPASQIRGLLEGYGVERLYLVPEPEAKRLQRVQRKGNKSRSYEEGWVEFTDKRIARAAAISLNGNKMINKKNNFYSEDTWQIRYLPKFKWDNLTEKFAYDARIRKQKISKQMNIAKKEKDFYSKKMQDSKKIQHIQNRMQRKRERDGNKSEDNTNNNNSNSTSNFQNKKQFNLNQKTTVKRNIEEDN